MEITIKNGNISVGSASKAELKELFNFLYGGEEKATEVSNNDNSVDEEKKETPKLAENKDGRKDDTVVKDGLVPLTQAAEMLHENRKTLTYHLQNGLFGEKIDGHWYVNVDEARGKLAKMRSENINPGLEAIHKKKITTVPEGYVTRTELSKISGLSPSTLQWHEKKGLPCYVVNGRTLFLPDECIKYLKNHTHPTEPKHIDKLNKNKPKTSFALWQKDMFGIMDRRGFDKGKACSLIYNKFKRIYGVNLDEVKRDYYKEKEERCPSTMQSVFYWQYEKKHEDGSRYENLFENLLNDLTYEEYNSSAIKA